MCLFVSVPQLKPWGSPSVGWACSLSLNVIRSSGKDRGKKKGWCVEFPSSPLALWTQFDRLSYFLFALCLAGQYLCPHHDHDPQEVHDQSRLWSRQSEECLHCLRGAVQVGASHGSLRQVSVVKETKSQVWRSQRAHHCHPGGDRAAQIW